MIPTGTQILSAVRGHLGDTEVAGGQLYTDTFLTNNLFYAQGYEALYKYLLRHGHKVLRRERYFNLPAYTSYLTPAGMGCDNMGNPLQIFDRSINITTNGTSLAVTGRSASSPPYVTVTCGAPHGLLDGAQVVTFGFGLGTTNQITDDVNGMWTVTAPSPTTLRLLGCSAVDLGSASSATGIVSTSVMPFPTTPLAQCFDLPVESPAIQNTTLTQWEWQGSAFRFVPSSVARQIKLVYELSAESPSFQGNVGIDSSLMALSLYIAGVAGSSKLGTASSIVQSCFNRAVGNPTGDTDRVDGGEFRSLAREGMKALNMTDIRIPRYRPRRNYGPFPLGGRVV